MSTRAQRICALLAISLFGGAAAAHEPPDKPMLWKSLTFRCDVAEGPRLERCAPLKAKGIDPRIVARSRLDVEGIPSCRLSGLTPGTTVNYPFPYSEDPRFLTLPRPLVMIRNPDWAEPPPLDAIAQLYPKQAVAAGLTARVVISCRVAASGEAQDCKVVEETAPGNGFGEAGLKAMTLMRFKPQKRDCTPTDDGTIRIPLVFAPPRSGR